MEIEFENSDISKFEADALIYSTNQNFNLSGGVGKSLVREYGIGIQSLLDRKLRELNLDEVPVGTIIEGGISQVPWKRIFHVVATDLDYETDSKIVRSILRECFEVCEIDYSINTIALSALGCGYGSMKESEFINILKEEYYPYGKAGTFKVILVGTSF
ncbi:macro domain-containing protein [Gynuella sp.]|uniref:macro domain-containing protein n=1 Tax=Gynuella sp. TaxID=2969146 RepID=UPI003D14AC88